MTTTLITGANRGIGLALARVAAQRGHTVLGTARDPDAATDLRDTGAEILKLDAADPGSVWALAGALAGRPIDILINNAAIFPNRTGLEGVNLDDFDATLRTNVRGPVAVTQSLLPNVRASERKTVATISSSMGSIANTKNGGSYAYRVSKAAVNMLTKALAAEFDDIIFLAVDPGWVRTDMGGSEASLTPEASAAGVLSVCENATREQSGAFLRHDGEPLPW
jgi:NAD(P)-dependent dehydrogenase (short-subunit alcohol dehydrogenase family)